MNKLVPSYFLALLCWLVVAVRGQTQPVTFQTHLGNITGQLVEIGPIKLAKFLGISYAKPPIDDLRFAKPEPYGEMGNYNATDFSMQCPQIQNEGIASDSSEDCLSLNIYTPYTSQPEAADKAVMIYVHGGGYTGGSGSIYPGEILSSFKDVLVITINYRLSIFGFLSTGDSRLPGNLGLWDQRLAFQWVKDNIGDYGGNSSSITILGESAGGSSVIYQMFSPHNDNRLFQRVITQSPNAMYLPLVERNPLHETLAIMNSLNCINDNTLVACLRSKTMEELLNATSPFLSLNIFYPIADDDFLMKGLGNLYRNFNINQSSSVYTKVMGNYLDYDLFGGWNDQEGRIYMSVLQSVNEKMTDVVNLDTGVSEKVMVDALHTYPFQVLSNKSAIGNRVSEYVQYYYEHKLPPEASAGMSKEDQRVEAYMKISGDLTLKLPFMAWIQIHSALGNKASFAYEFSHKKNYQGLWYSGPSWLNTGADHADEIVYILGIPYFPENPFNYTFTQSEKNLSTIMMSAWAGFAKTGNPGASFLQFDYFNGEKYTRITSTGLQVLQYPMNEAQSLWANLDPQAFFYHYREDSSPITTGSSTMISSVENGVVVGSGLITLTAREAGQVITGLLVGLILAVILLLLVAISFVIKKVKASQSKLHQDTISMH